MKTAMSSFDIAAITISLNQSLKETRIVNIYQLNHKTLLLKLRGSNLFPDQLLIEAGKRIHLTSYDYEKPKYPPSFCMALRKHLRNGRIKGVQQYEFERIVVIDIDGRGGDYQLISELFGEGNVILIDQEKRIIQALTYRRMKDRDIIPKAGFKHAPPSGYNPVNLKPEDLERLKEFGDLTVVKALTRFLSIGGVYAEEILLRSNVEKDMPCKNLTLDELRRIYYSLEELISSILEGRIDPRIYIDENGEWIDVTPIPLERYRHLRPETYRDFNEALDRYYLKLYVSDKLGRVEGDINQELRRLKDILHRQEEALKRLEERISRDRRIGNLIYEHINELGYVLEKAIEEKRRGKDWRDIIEQLNRTLLETGMIQIDNIIPENMEIQLSVGDLKFTLNLKRTIYENAAEYYERAKKNERKILGVKRAIQQTREKIERVKGKVIERKEKEVKMPRLRRRREWYEKFRWFISSDGFLVIGGRDASTNNILIRRYMEPNDMVFHTDAPGSPFVLIKTRGVTPPQRTIEEAAQLTASYSRGWREMLSTMNVYWVNPQQIGKAAPPGQYMPRGSFMIYGKRNYIRNVPLSIAIGVLRGENGEVKVIGGPVSAITNQTDIYVKIVPGEAPSGKLARIVRAKLASKAPEEYRSVILDIPIEEIQRFIPSGKGRIRED